MRARRTCPEDFRKGTHRICHAHGEALRRTARRPRGICSVEAAGNGHTRAIPDTSVADFPTLVSPNGEELAFLRRSTASGGGDIYELSLHGEPHPHPVVKTQAYERGAQFSPNGRWQGYVSNESGRFEVYLPYPEPDRRWPALQTGGLMYDGVEAARSLPPQWCKNDGGGNDPPWGVLRLFRTTT